MNDICNRLDEIISLKDGEMLPSHMCDESGNWAVGMRTLLRDAKAEIESLRAVAGKARAAPKYGESGYVGMMGDAW